MTHSEITEMMRLTSIMGDDAARLAAQLAHHRDLNRDQPHLHAWLHRHETAVRELANVLKHLAANPPAAHALVARAPV